MYFCVWTHPLICTADAACDPKYAASQCFLIRNTEHYKNIANKKSENAQKELFFILFVIDV